MKPLLLALLLALVAQNQPIKLYVLTKTDPSGLIDYATKARTASVEAVKRTLEKSKTVQLVGTAEDSTIQIEIGRTEEKEIKDNLSALNNALNGAHNADTKKVTYRFATLTSGSYSTELSERDDRKNQKALCVAIERWVKDNAAALAK